MAKENLPINFQDDILAESMNGKRRYRVINNSDGTISLDDVTEYTQVGSDFGQAQINKTNKAVNESLSKDGDASNVTNTFSPASTRTNLSSREKLGVSLGKIHKWFTDINAALFGNTIKTQDGKAGMTSDGEGGNLWFVSPKGVRWEMDAAVNESVRFFNYETMGGFMLDKQGNLYANDMLLRESNRWASDWIVHLENLYNQLNIVADNIKKYNYYDCVTTIDFPDCLHINTNVRESVVNRRLNIHNIPNSVDISGYPPQLTKGTEWSVYREVFWDNNQNVTVILTEVYPNLGRKYYAKWNAKAGWTAWVVK